LARRARIGCLLLLSHALTAAAVARPLAGPEPGNPVQVRVAGKATITVWPQAGLARSPARLPLLAVPKDRAPTAASVMVRPAAARPGVSLSSHYGARVDPFVGTVRMHNGMDFRAAAGSPVIATAAGEVAWAGWRNGYGNLVVLDHGGGLQTRFGHLSRTYVHTGERVARGAILGLVGSTGRSTGPHLHYEVRVGGQPIDPRAR